MRLFFGAFQDDETSRRLWSSARSLDLQGGSRDSPEKYYMTVVFVGQVPEHLVRDVREIGEARRSECITLRFGRWEYWPASRAVVATATDRPEPLMRLRQHLADELTPSTTNRCVRISPLRGNPRNRLYCRSCPNSPARSARSVSFPPSPLPRDRFIQWSILGHYWIQRLAAEKISRS
jgi:hypothetical protein